MHGNIVFFLKNEGYGFILGENNIRYYFNIHHVSYPLPRKNDEVSFTPKPAPSFKLNPTAENIHLITKSAKYPSESAKIAPYSYKNTEEKYIDLIKNSKVQCTKCGRYMIPYVIYRNDGLKRSICPFCGKTYKYFSPCFIATAVYSNHLASEVIAIRRFRNEFLSKFFMGRIFIKLYYRLSPTVAKEIKKHKILQKIIKPVLNMIAYIYGWKFLLYS